MSEVQYPTYVYQDANGQERAIQSKSGVPLTDAEVVSKGREHFGDAKFVRKVMPAGHPKTPIQKAVEGLPPRPEPTLQATSRPIRPDPMERAVNEQGETHEQAERRKLWDTLGLATSMMPAMAGPKLGVAALSGLPRLGRFLGLIGGGAAGGATGAAMGGRPADIPMEAAIGAGMGAAGGVGVHSAGAVARHGPGARVRLGNAMARDIEKVAGTQVPTMRGLRTGEQLKDWTLYGQEGLNTLYEGPKRAIMASLPPELATKAGQMAAQPTFTPRGGLVRPGLDVPALSPTPLSFEEALNTLKDKGRAFRGDKASAAVQADIQAWMEGKDQLRVALQQAGVPRSAIADFDNVTHQYALAMGWQDLLEGSFKQRVLLPALVQEALDKGSTSGDLLHRTRYAQDPAEFNAIADAILRGLKGETGKYAVGRTDVPGARLNQLIHSGATAGESGLRMRTWFGIPLAPLWTKHIAAPGRLPLEPGAKTSDATAVLAQWLREKVGQARRGEEAPAAE